MSATQNAGGPPSTPARSPSSRRWRRNGGIPSGKFKPLHMLNPCRLDYIVDQIAAEFGRNPKTSRPFAGLRLLDVGCGGGLLAEPMARLGEEVVGVDAAPRNIPVARLHAAQSELVIDYRHGTAEALAADGERFDVVLAMEVIEHVSDPPAFLAACRALLRPGGLLICSTLNRNPKSWLMAIVGAEHVMRWLPVGTHDWRRFITPGRARHAPPRRRPRSGRPQGFRLRPARLELAPLRPRPLGQLRRRRRPSGRTAAGLTSPCEAAARARSCARAMRRRGPFGWSCTIFRATATSPPGACRPPTTSGGWWTRRTPASAR